MRLLTWNINSVRLRIDLLERLVREQRPDVVCLQEIKCMADQFPIDAVRALGFKHVLVNGQKGYHGVATLSRFPLELLPSADFNGTGDARYLGCIVKAGRSGSKRLALHNVYAPAGGDIADVTVNPKFAQKLRFYGGMTDWSSSLALPEPSVLVGDLNIAPSEHDVWSHKQLLSVVSHTPIEVEHFARFVAAHGWHDAVRASIPADHKLFTWWSYRSADWRANNRGRRLDHVLTSPSLVGAARKVDVTTGTRDWERPSDHVPVSIDLELG